MFKSRLDGSNGEDRVVIWKGQDSRLKEQLQKADACLVCLRHCKEAVSVEWSEKGEKSRG